MCGGDRDGEDRGLRVLGELELVFGALEDELREGEAEGLVGLVEDGARGGELVVEIASHSNGLRALTRKEEGYFRHRDYRKRPDARLRSRESMRMTRLIVM